MITNHSWHSLRFVDSSRISTGGRNLEALHPDPRNYALFRSVQAPSVV